MKPKRSEVVAILQTLRWLAMPARPGDLEELEAIVGRDPDGRRWELQRPDKDGTVRAVGPDEVEVRLAPEEVGIWLRERRFIPETVRVVQTVTDRLFDAAVRAAERATASEGKAELAFRNFTEDDDEDDEELDWQMLETIGYLRESVSPSLEAIVFAVATAEAQVNEWGQWDDKDDKKTVVEKCKLLAASEGRQLDTNQDGWRWFVEAVKARHRIVHAKPGSEERSITRPDGPRQSSRARSACAGVRHVLVELAGLRGESPPDYLMLSPHDPEDLRAWLTAIVSSGIREDPVFGTYAERAKSRSGGPEPARGEAPTP